MNECNHKEIDDAINQASAGLMLQIWVEVSKLFLEFITKSAHSPCCNVKATFARREYESNSGNLTHSHIIIAINKKELSNEQIEFVNNLACGSVFDMVRSKDIYNYIQKKIIKSKEDVLVLVDKAIAFFTHKCSNRYLIETSDGNLRCCMPKNIYMSPDNTKQNFVDIPNQISDRLYR